MRISDWSSDVCSSDLETEEAKTVGEWYGTQFTTMQEAATAATSSNARLDRLGQLLENVATGKTAPTTQAIKAVAKSAGFALVAFGITDDVGPAEAAAALSNHMTLELRHPAGGAGMPGALGIKADRERGWTYGKIPGG